MPGAETDRNLIFGVVALQMDFVARDALIAAMNAWELEKQRPIGEVLVERGALDAADRDALEAMVERHVARHGGDARAGLEALSSVERIAADLRRSVDDPKIRESLAVSRFANDSDAIATRMPAGDHGDPSADVFPAPIRYRKVRPHAKGGMGIVFVAVDRELNREVALKEIQDRHADDEHSRARFLVEAEITGGLEHPGIVPVYGLGRYADGRPFYAMRFIGEDSLKDAIAAFHRREAVGGDPGARSLALQKLLRRLLDVCDAIEYAHSRGVLHRDLKPHNIMVGRYGETLVVDWGLAKASRRLRRGRRPRGGSAEVGSAAGVGEQPGRDAPRVEGRYARIHEPGAGRRPARPARPRQRRVQSRRDALHPADRQAAGDRPRPRRVVSQGAGRRVSPPARSLPLG